MKTIKAFMIIALVMISTSLFSVVKIQGLQIDLNGNGWIVEENTQAGWLWGGENQFILRSNYHGSYVITGQVLYGPYANVKEFANTFLPYSDSLGPMVYTEWTPEQDFKVLKKGGCKVGNLDAIAVYGEISGAFPQKTLTYFVVRKTPGKYYGTYTRGHVLSFCTTPERFDDFKKEAERIVSTTIYYD